MYFGTANNCVIRDNSASDGGGIYDGTANSCLIVNNGATDDGGGVYDGTANNSTVSHNDGHEMYAGEAKNTILYGGSYSVSAVNCYTANPLFVDANNGDYRLSLNSPCIDAGANAYVGTETDLDGNPRILNGIVDIGAYEYAPFPIIGIDTSSLSASVSEGTTPSPSAFRVWNRGISNMNYTITDDVSWLSETPATGTSTGETDVVTVEYDTTGLAIGSYTGTITVASVDAGNTPQTIAVFLTVVPPSIGLNRTSIRVSTNQGDTPSIETLTVQNVANNSAMDYTITDNVPWLSTSPSSGSSVGEVDTIDVQFDATGLLAGLHTGLVTVSSSGADNSPQTVEVGLLVLASDVYVSTSGDDTNRGTSWADAKVTIQAGVDATMEGGTVWVTNGHYRVVEEILVDKAISIQSVNGPGVTIVDGMARTRCFNLGSYPSVLSGLTITNGYVVGDGGGVHCSNYAPMVTNCVISGNSASDHGGGMYRGTASGCMISDNSASSAGGGMYSGKAYNCTIRGNSTYLGGGIGSGTANNCTISDNVASGKGGGMYYGTANGCLIVENSASDDGAGMYYGTANSSTIVNNNGNYQMYQGDAKNSILYGSIYSVGQNNCYTDDPFFVDANNGDYRLSLNSPCIDGGANTHVNTEADLDGNPRILNDTVDIGAYEYTPVPLLELSPTSLFTSVNLRSSPAPEVLLIWNPGFSNMNYTITDNVSWLSTSPSSGSSAGEVDTIDVQFDTAGLAAGSYTGAVTVTSANADNGPLAVSVLLTVVPPSMALNKASIEVSVNQGQLLSAETFTLENSGNDAEMAYSITDSVSWLSVVPAAGSSTGEIEVATVQFDTTGLVAGSYTGLITVAADDASNSPQTIDVGLLVLASNVYVAMSGDDTNSGTSWADAKATIQAGVDAVSEGGTVWVTNGHYRVVEQIAVDKAITIESINGPDVTTVDAQTYDRCFHLGGHASLLCGLTIVNGYAAGNGGGVYCSDYDPVLTNCIITGNSATGDGGGMHRGTAKSCTINGNSASNGGGGGLYSGNAYACTIQSNSASGYGGGMRHGTARSCTISDNTASAGGGMYFGNSYNCIIVKNSASGSGAGMCKGTADNCTLADNNGTYQMYEGSAKNSILVGNTYSVEVSACYTGDPLFADAVSGDYHLALGSPCIDAGANAYVSTETDLDGNPRILNGIVDVGAYEYIPVPLLELAPSSLFVSANTGDTPLATNFSIWNPGFSNMIYTITDNVSWLTTSPSSGSSAGEVDAIDVQADTTGMAVGSYTGLITVTSSNASDSPRIVEVTLQILTSNMYVTTSGDDANSGMSWADAKATIQAGVDAAIEGGTVWVSNGTYSITSQIAVDSPMTIRSVNGPDVTVVDAGYYSRVFNLQDSECTVSGLMIMNGFAHDNGGGVLCSGSNPVLTNCIVTNNISTDYGGGVYMGKAYNCILTGNAATERGGGGYSVTAHSCTIRENRSDLGGGIYGGTANNCLIVENTTSSYGGGAHSATANNCTICDNSSDRYGGGMYGGVANNSIIYYNEGLGSQPDVSSGTAAYGSCASTLVDGSFGNTAAEPQFRDQPDGDYRLHIGSPCVDAGINALTPFATDLDGQARIVNTFVDMGAYEHQQDEADNDADGLTNPEELLLGTDPDNPDSDGDGLNDGAEVVAGTSPTDRDSVFSIASITPIDGSNLVLQWPSVTNRTYSVYSHTNLLTVWPIVPVFQIQGDGGMCSYTNALPGSPRYFEVGVELDQ